MRVSEVPCVEHSTALPDNAVSEIPQKILKNKIETYLIILLISVNLNCGSTSKDNCTYLVLESTQKFSSLTDTCTYTICNLNSKICRLRFDFRVWPFDTVEYISYILYRDSYHTSVSGPWFKVSFSFIGFWYCITNWRNCEGRFSCWWLKWR